MPRAPHRRRLPVGRVLVACLLLSAAAGIGGSGGRVEAAPHHPADIKIAPWVLAATAQGQPAEMIVVLAQQADLSGAAAMPTKAEKGRFVFDTLRGVARLTQRPLLDWLQEQGVPYRAFYIVNAVWVKGDLALARALAARADVARVAGNPEIAGSLGWPGAAPAAAPEGVEASLQYVNADDVWSLGFTGQGIVLGGQDTGYRWDHAALKAHYRGWDGATADHDYNWHDSIHSGSSACGTDSPAPCDDYGHGTHTMGTAVGDDGGANRIGMAPGAQWIGCRNMRGGVGTPATYLECFEFFMAPYPVGGDPTDGDPGLAPHVTNNSWGCPPAEGCTVGDELLAAVQAQRAAGIMTVASAGNNGSMGCNTVDDPPAIYGETFSVGALNTGTDGIAFFSSRGAVDEDGSNRLKPNLVAPGTSIRSSTNELTNSYGPNSGTSMASPHVAGAVALLWSAVPALQGQISLTEEILTSTAVHISSTACGDSGWPNNTYGYGRLNVKAAVDAALEQYSGGLAGAVTNVDTGLPVAGAVVTAIMPPAHTYTGTTAGDGTYSLGPVGGTYTVTVTASGFLPAVAGVTVQPNLTTTLPISLYPELLHILPLIRLAEGASGASLAPAPAPGLVGPAAVVAPPTSGLIGRGR